jgi:hypothetical protein
MFRRGPICCAIGVSFFGVIQDCVLSPEVSAREAEVRSSASGLSASRASDRATLALRYAPVHYQDVDLPGRHGLGGKADYITRYDFDGDLDARNNWENAGKARHPLAAHAYYSVVETGTHWFIVYLFFHPRDWTNAFFELEHENDAEGLLIAVARDGSRYGSLKAAVTVAHTNFYSYVPSGSDWSARDESVDGKLELVRYEGALHPVTAQESEGHGLKARPDYDLESEGVIYYPSLAIAEVPEHPDDRSVRYRLIDVFEPAGMFAQRKNPALFASYGTFAGDRAGGCGSGALGCTRNAANAPWGWDDSDDRVPRGALAADPAGLVKSYFTSPEAVSTSYSFNPYR